MLALAMYRLLFAMCSVYASLQLCSADNNEELEEGTLMHCLKTCTPVIEDFIRTQKDSKVR